MSGLMQRDFIPKYEDWFPQISASLCFLKDIKELAILFIPWIKLAILQAVEWMDSKLLLIYPFLYLRIKWLKIDLAHTKKVKQQKNKGIVFERLLASVGDLMVENVVLLGGP